MNTFYIYTLNDPRTDAIKYVGVTTNLKARMSVHASGEKSTKKAAWYDELKGLGLKPKMEVVSSCQTPDEAAQIEIDLYDQYNNGTLVCADPRLARYKFTPKDSYLSDAYQVRIEPDLYEKAVKAGKKLGLSFSAYVRYLISKDVDK